METPPLPRGTRFLSPSTELRKRSPELSERRRPSLRTDSASRSRSSWGHFNKTLGQMSGKTPVKLNSRSLRIQVEGIRFQLSLHKLHQLLSLFYPVKTYRGFSIMSWNSAKQRIQSKPRPRIDEYFRFFSSNYAIYLTLFPIGDFCDKNPSLGSKWTATIVINEVISGIIPINGLISMVTGVITTYKVD